MPLDPFYLSGKPDSFSYRQCILMWQRIRELVECQGSTENITFPLEYDVEQQTHELPFVSIQVEMLEWIEKVGAIRIVSRNEVEVHQQNIVNPSSDDDPWEFPLADEKTSWNITESINITVLKPEFKKFYKQILNELSLHGGDHEWLNERERFENIEIKFSIKEGILYIGEHPIELGMNGPSYYLLLKMTKYNAGKVVDWGSIADIKDGAYENSKMEKDKDGWRPFYDAVRRVNKKIKEIPNINGDLFTWHNLSVTLNHKIIRIK